MKYEVAFLTQVRQRLVVRTCLNALNFLLGPNEFSFQILHFVLDILLLDVEHFYLSLCTLQAAIKILICLGSPLAVGMCINFHTNSERVNKGRRGD